MAKMILIRTVGCAVLLCLGFLGLTAQDRPPVSGPVLGFVSEGAGGIRPILGLPGAATLGRPTWAARRSETVVFSPSRDYALALHLPDHRVDLLRGLSAAASAVDLPVPAGAGRIAISPSGDTAVLYYPESRSVAVLAGLPEFPSLSWSLEVPHLTGGLAALAVSDDAGAVLLAAGAPPTSRRAHPGSAEPPEHLVMRDRLSSVRRRDGCKVAMVGRGGMGSGNAITAPWPVSRGVGQHSPRTSNNLFR
jgi:hypothetical protein